MCGGGGWTVEGEGSGAQNRKFPGGALISRGGAERQFWGFGGLGPQEPPKKQTILGCQGGGARPRPRPPLFCASRRDSHKTPFLDTSS